MWWYAVAWVVAFVVAVSMIPKPQDPTPASFEDLEAPTAEEGRDIPVLFGTRDISGPNVVWYGDLKVEAVRKKGGKK